MATNGLLWINNHTMLILGYVCDKH